MTARQEGHDGCARPSDGNWTQFNEGKMDLLRERELAALRDQAYRWPSSPRQPVELSSGTASDGGALPGLALAALLLTMLLFPGDGPSGSARYAREAALRATVEARWRPRLRKALDTFSRQRDLEALAAVRRLSTCHRQAFDTLLRGGTTRLTCLDEEPQSGEVRAYLHVDRLDFDYSATGSRIWNEVSVMAITPATLRGSPTGDFNPVATAALLLGRGAVEAVASRRCLAVVADRYISNGGHQGGLGFHRRERMWVYANSHEASLACPDGKGYRFERSQPFTIAEDVAG